MRRSSTRIAIVKERNAIYWIIVSAVETLTVMNSWKGIGSERRLLSAAPDAFEPEVGAGRGFVGFLRQTREAGADSLHQPVRPGVLRGEDDQSDEDEEDSL